MRLSVGTSPSHQPNMALRRRPALAGSVSACLIVLAACAGSSVVIGPAASSTPVSPTPTITLGAQSCETSLAAAPWPSLIPSFDASSQHIEPVTCGDLKRDGHQEALVPVRYDGTAQFLDFYVFGPPAGGAAPVLLFSRAGTSGRLYKGAVRISDDNTLVSAEVDQGSCINRAAPFDAPFQLDHFREWRWNGSDFVQVVFPGLFPAFTRYQAEDFERQGVEVGTSLWALDPVQETNTFATQWLAAGTTPGATLVSSTSTQAQTHLGNFTVTLQRLAYPAHPDHAIWEVTGVLGQQALTVAAPAALASVTSPISISGTGYTFAAGNFATQLWEKVGVATATVPNCILGSGTIHSGASTPPAAPFAGSLAYTPDRTGLVEDALLWVDEASARGDGSFASLQLIKVLAG
jgi:hypothetical protein